MAGRHQYRKAGYRTGLWLGELTHFYDYANDNGFELDFDPYVVEDRRH